MFPKLQLDARRVYLFMEIAFTICFCLFDTASALYLVTIAGLAPLQLVLVGTTTEVFGFLFEVPTGVVADVYSRRLSIIIGYVLVGLGLFVEGLFPAYLPILLATVLFSIGSTFLSGAKEAWITDEIGEESANKLFLRVRRYGAFAWLTGLGLTLLIGANHVVWPLLVSGIGILLIALVLMVIMPETGFHPTPQEDRNTFQHMGHIFHEGVKAVRAQPRLFNIVFIALFYGLYSEGFDRLSVKLLLDNFHVPVLLAAIRYPSW
jgi:MFS transporter, DHA3 family, tetracycline resistance protein